jgi:voltage-gated potassium channel
MMSAAQTSFINRLIHPASAVHSEDHGEGKRLGGRHPWGMILFAQLENSSRAEDALAPAERQPRTCGDAKDKDEGSMTEVLYEQLAPAKRRRLVLRASLEAVATTTVLVVLYYALPLDERSDAWTVTQLIFGLVVLAGIVAWQVRAIIGAEFPRVRMLQALFVAVPFYVLLFAAAYFLIAGSGDANFAEPLSRTDALYFTVTVLSTVGFGDITPKSEIARLVVTLQMIANLILIGLGARTLFGAAQLGLQRRSEARPGRR